MDLQFDVFDVEAIEEVGKREDKIQANGGKPNQKECEGPTFVLLNSRWRIGDQLFLVESISGISIQSEAGQDELREEGESWYPGNIGKVAGLLQEPAALLQSHVPTLPF
jgi:hypothetical protein